MDWITNPNNNIKKLELFYNTHVANPTVSEDKKDEKKDSQEGSKDDPKDTNEEDQQDIKILPNSALADEYHEIFIDLISDIVYNKISSADLVNKLKALVGFKASNITQDIICDALWFWGSQVSQISLTNSLCFCYSC